MPPAKGESRKVFARVDEAVEIASRIGVRLVHAGRIGAGEGVGAQGADVTVAIVVRQRDRALILGAPARHGGVDQLAHQPHRLAQRVEFPAGPEQLVAVGLGLGRLFRRQRKRLRGELRRQRLARAGLCRAELCLGQLLLQVALGHLAAEVVEIAEQAGLFRFQRADQRFDLAGLHAAEGAERLHVGQQVARQPDALLPELLGGRSTAAAHEPSRENAARIKVMRLTSRLLYNEIREFPPLQRGWRARGYAIFVANTSTCDSPPGADGATVGVGEPGPETATRRLCCSYNSRLVRGAGQHHPAIGPTLTHLTWPVCPSNVRIGGGLLPYKRAALRWTRSRCNPSGLEHWSGAPPVPAATSIVYLREIRRPWRNNRHRRPPEADRVDIVLPGGGVKQVFAPDDDAGAVRTKRHCIGFPGRSGTRASPPSRRPTSPRRRRCPSIVPRTGAGRRGLR